MAPLAKDWEDVVYKPGEWSSMGPQNNPVNTQPVDGVLPTGIIIVIVVSVVGGLMVFGIITWCLINQSRKGKRKKAAALGRAQHYRHHRHNSPRSTRSGRGSGKKSMDQPVIQEIELHDVQGGKKPSQEIGELIVNGSTTDTCSPPARNTERAK
ncbi:hypothetical protein MKZ38_008675 [Zalerion maritima]|uniref:Uncharacterized protein n=1 Tax=Zalerion maritima TaxID=339359 RepID=A0AAD5WNI8_9PEZI|nr:hypothetical protein MKZ38_008675 [Zalerion maritima]